VTPRVRLTTVAAGAATLALADLDGDAVLDVVVGAADEDTISWIRSDGSGESAGRVVIADDVASIAAVACADVDGDGDVDVFSASPTVNGGLRLFLNNGTGSFVPLQAAALGGSDARVGAEAMTVVDLDGDGKLDVVAASHTVDSSLAWLRGSGDGTFASTWTTIASTFDVAASVVAADLDGDGAVDLLTATPDSDTLAWHRALGGGAFAAATTISTTLAGTLSAIAADMDGDGDLDVVAAGTLDGTISLFPNEGGGSFGPPSTVATSLPGVRSLVAVDFDGDGRLDLAAAATGSTVVSWYHNGGLASFTPHPISATMAIASPAALAVASLTGTDGRPDLVVAGLEGFVGVFINGGAGGPGTTTPSPAGGDGPGDGDGDGSVDEEAGAPSSLVLEGRTVACWLTTLALFAAP
jgi:hypothetical protein